LELYLTHPVTLAIIMFDNPVAERVLSKAGVPFIALGNSARCRVKGCVGHVRYDRSASSDDFAAYVASIGAKSVLQIGMEGFDDVGAALSKAGVEVRRMDIPRLPFGSAPADVAFAACDAFAAKLAKSRNWLPDLIYFSDDYVCAGALAAFADAGVRIPEDVRVVTWANRGNCPVHTKPLARMEMDPENDAKKVAAALVDCLEGRGGVFPLTLGPVFKVGKMV
jgi:DNA-binding LacI/PurR family transcriptional regulator